MFDIGFLELMMVSVVGLLVLGPDRLPGAIRTVNMYVTRIRRSFNSVRAEIERELKTDEIRQELHNQSVMKELRKAEKELRNSLGVDDMKIGKDGYPLGEGAPDAPEPVPPGPTTEPTRPATPQAGPDNTSATAAQGADTGPETKAAKP